MKKQLPPRKTMAQIHREAAEAGIDLTSHDPMNALRLRATTKLYQIVETSAAHYPMNVRPLGKPHKTYLAAKTELESFLWEECGQQQGDRPENWLGEIGLTEQKDYYGNSVWGDYDHEFEWRILEIDNEAVA